MLLNGINPKKCLVLCGWTNIERHNFKLSHDSVSEEIHLLGGEVVIQLYNCWKTHKCIDIT
jgi:hypothetical protein